MPPAKDNAQTDDEREELFGALSKDELSDLTPEELEGVDGEESADDADDGDDEANEDEKADGDDEESAEGDDDAKAEDDDGDDGDGDGEAGDADESEEAEEGAQDADAEEAADAEADSDDDDLSDLGVDLTPPPIPAWKAPENAEESLKALEAKLEEVATKFDDGDIGAAEFHKQTNAINAERANIVQAVERAQMAFEMRQSHFVNVAKAFIAKNPQYDPEKRPIMYNMIDAEVQRLQRESDDPFDPRLIAKAHKAIQKEIGATAEEPAGKPPAAKKPKGKPHPDLPDKSKKPKVPQTLARIPADEVEDTDGGKFARLERLSDKDPIAYEEALAKMSPADRDRYLAGG